MDAPKSPDRFNVFLSYSRNDPEAAANLRAQLERHDLSVFRDEDSIREGDRWLEKLQEAVERCGAFVVLVGRDRVQRWVGAETQVALGRHFGPHEETDRLPIFPVLLGDTGPEALPAFLRLFQATRWNGSDSLSGHLLEAIREKTTLPDDTAIFEGSPFVGLDAFRIDQARLFFGRQKETLDALACFERQPGRPPVRWLEINGNSGAGKSSLMNAGLLPLVDQGWLWARTGIERWRRIGPMPMMPGERPVAMLAEQLAREFEVEMGDVRDRLLKDGEPALAMWLRGRKQDDTAFLLAIDQFEELFTLAEPDERKSFDRLLAAALEDPDCPLYVISTVRADFLDRVDELPRLVAVRNRLGKPWTLPPISTEGLREIIEGPARLAGLDVSDVQAAMVREAEDEPGALPLVENALHWLWEQREGNCLSGRLFTDQGGLAGILSRSADDLLAGLDRRARERALELLFRMVRVDPEGRRHTRRRIPLTEAIEAAGGGDDGRALVDRLAGARKREGSTAAGPLRLITVTEGGTGEAPTGESGRWVNLIHETLIRSKGVDDQGKPQPYWPTLWDYIERNKARAARRERLGLMAREWSERRGLARLFGLAGWASLFGFRGLAAPGSTERRYLRWSRGRAVGEIFVSLAILLAVGTVFEGVIWAADRELPRQLAVERFTYWIGISSPPLPELVKIADDSFDMGSKDSAYEQPVRKVTIAHPFEIGATEVTFAQWDACVLDGGCEGYHPNDLDWGQGKQPVISVSWDGVQTYLKWLSGKTGKRCRLPSEAEWEYAARADTTMKYALPADQGGSDDIAGQNLANCDGCGSEWDNRQTAPVGSFPPNAWGLHDMHGNVWEWVADCWHDSYDVAPDDGSARTGEESCPRVLRGGSWDFAQDDARAATRVRGYPDARYGDVGFRVLCSSP